MLAQNATTISRYNNHRTDHSAHCDRPKTFFVEKKYTRRFLLFLYVTYTHIILYSRGSHDYELGGEPTRVLYTFNRRFTPYLWNPIPFIRSSLSSTSSVERRRHTSAISCFDRACWGLAGVDGFNPLGRKKQICTK